MRWRLLAAFIGVMLVMLLAQDIPLAGHLRQVELDRQLAELERDAFVLAASTTEALEFGDATELANMRETVRSFAAADERHIVVTDAAGVVQAATPGSGATVGDDLAADADIAAALDTQSAAGDADDTVSVAVPVLRGAQAIGVVRLATPSAVVDERADDKVRGLLLVAGISLGAAVLAALVLSRSVTRPLRRLQLGTERVAGGEFAAPVDEDEGPPEVRQLARSFNAMTDRISGLVAEQRAFAGDASHQLRTPLTALRLQLERTAALIEHDPDGARRNLEAATDETARLQRLIDGLLMLARNDDTRPAERHAIDVGEVVRDRVDSWQPLAEERGVALFTSVGAAPSVLVAAGSLEQILDNYLDNAIEVAPPGTAVEVHVVPAGTTVTVHVLDRGPGLTDEQRAHAFERFWRAPDAGPDGSGLGLTIVARLAAASGASVALSSRAGGGLDATVTLTVAPTVR